eukprot:Gb_33238 [translate_table: standard]
MAWRRLRVMAFMALRFFHGRGLFVLSPCAWLVSDVTARKGPFFSFGGPTNHFFQCMLHGFRSGDLPSGPFGPPPPRRPLWGLLLLLHRRYYTSLSCRGQLRVSIFE